MVERSPNILVCSTFSANVTSSGHSPFSSLCFCNLKIIYLFLQKRQPFCTGINGGTNSSLEAIRILMNYTVMEEGGLRKGPWLEEEDDHLAATVAVLGDRKWDALAKASGICLK